MSSKKKTTAFPKDPETDTVPGFKIEQADIPPRTSKKQSKYPWALLEVSEQDPKTKQWSGPSFFIPEKTAKGFGASCYSAGKRLGYKFRVRNSEKDGVSGVRVWRVA